jgi:hypothetical protein
MPDGVSTWLLLASLLSLVCVIVGGVAGGILVWRLERHCRRLEEHLDELSRRLAHLERQVPRSEERTSKGAIARRADPPASAAPTLHAPASTSARPTLIAVPDLGGEGLPGEVQAAGELGQKHREIWSLAEAGLRPEEIARRTGQPIGEVELIVGLYRQLHPLRGATDHVRPR